MAAFRCVGASMRWLVVTFWAGLSCAVGGCSINQTSKVADTVTTSTLAASKKAVAVMRLGAASAACVNVAILLGVREGEGYRRHQKVMVVNVRSLTDTPAAEIELDPGLYHIIGYQCVADKGATAVVDPSTTPGLYRTSYAHFTLAAGEIVNIGYFQFGASHEGRSLFGRKVRTDISVTDWPLAEIQRFQRLRPALYAQMTTRLMVVNDGVADPQDQQQICATWQKLQAEGKAATLPPECGGSKAKTVRR